MLSFAKTARAMLLALLPTATACDESYIMTPLDPPLEDAKLVAYSFFQPGETWQVLVSRSAPLSGGDLDGVANATVDVYQGSTRVERLSFWTQNGQAWYRGRTAPVAGKTYTLKVSAPSMPALEGSGSAPIPVALRNVTVRLVRVERHDDVDYRTYEFDLDVPDPSGPSFFRLRLTESFETSGGTQQAPVVFCTTDPLLRQSLIDLEPGGQGSTCFSREGALFSGETFDGQTRRITVQTTTATMKRTDIHLERLSEDTYRFERTRRFNELLGDNPFTEPLDLYTNLRGGLGLFAGHADAQVNVGLPR